MAKNTKKAKNVELNSFIARVSYMVYMDNPTGDANPINTDKIAWALTHDDNDVTTIVERSGVCLTISCGDLEPVEFEATSPKELIKAEITKLRKEAIAGE